MLETGASFQDIERAKIEEKGKRAEELGVFLKKHDMSATPEVLEAAREKIGIGNIGEAVRILKDKHFKKGNMQISLNDILEVAEEIKKRRK